MATIKGVWVFNDTIKDEITGLGEDAVLDVLFTSNGTQFSSMCYLTLNTEDEDTVCFIYYNGVDSADNVTAVDGLIGNISTWHNEAYKTVDFGTTAQTVPDTFLAWMQTNAVLQGTPTAESVKANIIALISTANTKTGKNDATLTEAVITLMGGYGKGETIEEYDGTVVITEPEAEPTLISFTIDGTSYKAEEGMTWAEWLANDDYNTSGFWSSLLGGKMTVIIEHTGISGYGVAYNDEFVVVGETIVSDRAYSAKYSKESGGAG